MIITAVAGGVLVLALAVRVTRRLRARRRSAATPGSPGAAAETVRTEPAGLTP